MQDLTLVGLTEDKKRLLMVSDAGEEYTLPADAKLRAALRGEVARPGELEIQMESALRPRDIQARIRAGESPEAVAQAAQTTVDRIMGYATPVLAERAHIAERAQRASVRRKSGEGPARVLGDAVAERLRARNISPESVEWDAWRREDGRWTLVARYRGSDRERKAEFVFDAPGRYVVPEDDEARALLGEQPTRKAPARGPQEGSSRRLSAVSTEEELPLGTDALEMVAGDSGEADEETTVDLTQTARQAREHPAPGDPARPTGDADWMATQASDRPAARGRRPLTSIPGEAGRADGGAVEEPEQSAQQAIQHTAEQSPEEQPEEAAPKKAGRKGRRASVPSWDEIMFGGGRSE